MATEVLMPRQGQSVESCLIIGWKVREGDTVTEGQPLCDVETDKAVFEVEATASGTLLEIFYPDDTDVEVLKVIAAIGEPGEDVSGLRPVAPSDAEDLVTDRKERLEKIPAPSAVSRPTAGGLSGADTGVSPRARHLAERKGVDVHALAGTGPAGRVIERDVISALEGRGSISPAAIAKYASIPDVGSGIGGRVLTADIQLPAIAPSVPEVSYSEEKMGPLKEQKVKGVRKLIASRMLSSLQTTAQLTLHSSADARAILSIRKQFKASDDRAGITVNDLILYAVAQTVATFPEMNAYWLGDKIVQFEQVHLGFAVDTPRGLMVPVIRGANKLSLEDLSAETARLAQACIDGTVDADALAGGTFTVTNLGALGIERFTPILNAPEVAILGVCNIQPKPVITGSDVAFIPHLGLSLTFNHCAVDGAPAARFMGSLMETLDGLSF